MTQSTQKDRALAGILNLGIVLVFAAAWAADQWPSASISAVVFAVVIVVAELAILYSMAKKKESPPESVESAAGERLAHQAISPKVKERDVVNSSSRDGGSTIALINDFSTYALHAETLKALEAMNRAQEEMLGRALASRPSTWALDSLQRYTPVFVPMGELLNRRSHAALRPYSTLESWKIFPLAAEAFNVEAGAFTIEHTMGHTLIVVHDSSLVTVESDGAPTLRGVWDELEHSDA